MSRPGPRIVFLIDRYQGDNEESVNNKIIANINLSCMRILSYYKHFYCMHEIAAKSSISWGYKFFNSSQKQSGYHYKQFKFLDYATHNFDKFENELYEGIEYYPGTMSENKMPGDKLRVALTEIITDFQWDQPELFSPGKGWKREEGDGDRNLLFLFTAFSGSFDVGKSYFDECFNDSRSFIECLFPHVLYDKFVNNLKIRLLWIDTGSYISNAQVYSVGNRALLENALRSIGGSYVEMMYLSSWWIWHKKKDSSNSDHEKQLDANRRGCNIHTDITSVSSLVKGLLDNCEDDENDSTCYTLCYGFLTDAIISLSPISSLNETGDGKHVGLSIHVSDVVDPRRVELNGLSADTGYFYVLNTRSAVGNKNLSDNLSKLMMRGEILKVTFIPPHSCTAHHALLIPASAFAGTIILLYNTEEILKAHPEVQSCIHDDDENDVHEELECQLRRNLKKTNRELGMALANLTDTWFLSNPKLGFPLPLKNILTSLCDITSKKRKREESSKHLVEYMKGVYGKNETKKVAKVLNQVEGVRISPALQRLMEYRRRKCEKLNPACDKLCEENANEIVDKVTENNPSIKTSAELLSPTRDFNDCVLLEYETILQDSELCYNKIGSIVERITKHYKSENEESYTECSLLFLRSVVLKTVEDIRDRNIDNPKEHLIKEYLLQVHFYLEVVDRLKPPETDNILNTVVSFLRTVLFEESTVFVTKHLNEKVLTRFPNLTGFLHKIYDDLMLIFPDDLDESNESDVEDVPLVKSVESCSVGSYGSSENSPYSFQQGRRTLKRVPSIVGDNANKKVITVQMKKTTAMNNKSSDSSDKVVKRTLFTQNPPTSGILTTPKAQRRKSESALKKTVPDTPEGQQLNNMMWKKLERKRRHSCIDKNMVTIEESPLKEIASPIKRKSSFYRSNSFNCHTSPRRFYTLKRHPTMLVGNHGLSSTFEIDEKVSNQNSNHDENKVGCAVSASPMEVKLRRRSTLFSNFDTEEEEDNVQDENQCLSEEDDNNEKSAFRRKIFDSTPVKEKTDNFTFKLFGTDQKDCKRRKLSLEENLATDDKQPSPLTNCGRTDEVCDVVEPQFMSATTVDWLREIEIEQSKTPTNFHDAFASMFSDTSTPPLSQKSSPAIVKAGNMSIKVSPCLSASSIERLENAPIISPVIERKVTRRKGRLLNL